MQRELERTVQPSLLDRLTDLDPRLSADARITFAESLRQFKDSVQRDLEWLLNTRCTPEEVPELFEEVQRSLYRYGLPDITSFSRDSRRSRQHLLQRIEEAITLFEPRLSDVRLRMVEQEGEQHRRELRFAVAATLHMDPTPEQVVFDTVLEFSSGEYQVAGAQNA